MPAPTTPYRHNALSLLPGVALIVMFLASLPACAGADDRTAGGQGPPMTTDAAFEIRRESFSGEVTEVAAAGSYTYFGLRLPDASTRWVVIHGRGDRDASWLAVDSFGRRTGFVSRRLNRRFDELYFASIHDRKR